MNNKQRTTTKSIVFIIIFLILIGSLLFYAWRGIYLPKNPNSKEEKIFTIQKGEGTREISSSLEKQGFIQWGPLFRIYTHTKGIAGKLQAGEYSISPSMTIPEIVEKFVDGDVVKIMVTIPEGFTINDIEKRLIENGLDINSEIKTKKAELYKNEFQFLASLPDDFNLEGYLFPDTYQFSYRITPEEIVKKMLSNLDQKLTSNLREEISHQGKSIFEIITMASLIEKEVKTFEDKKIVSGILWKRIENNMPLQVDATISYITGGKSNQISVEETKIDSPYNTYKYRGLPLGPICNPGLESIMAAVYPKSSDYWYYLSTPDGQTIFSKTFDEHIKAKEKYLK